MFLILVDLDFTPCFNKGGSVIYLKSKPNCCENEQVTLYNIYCDQLTLLYF